jgi:hypothetical protein
MKKCNKCKIKKVDSSFHWKNKANGIRNSTCKDCRNIDKSYTLLKGNYTELYKGYLIYDDGRIFSTKSRKELKQSYWNSGYLFVTLRVDNKSVQISVHRLVALGFIPNPEKKETVNHIDGNKTNNHISNLEWYTQSEQIKHAIDNGLNRKPPSWLGKSGYKHNRSKTVYQFSDGVFIKEFGSAAECEREMGYSGGTVCGCIKRNGVTRDGFMYSYELTD